MAADLDLVATRPLEFGALVVPGSGTVRVSPDGSVTASGIIPLNRARPAPAEFILIYRPRGLIGTGAVQLVLNTPPTLTRDGTTGVLSGISTDLPGFSSLIPGQAQIYTFTACRQPTCTVTFRVGATLTLTGGAADGRFSFPLSFTARVVAES